MDIGNLISGSSAFLKIPPEHLEVLGLCEALLREFSAFTLLACEMSAIVQLFELLALSFFGIGMKTDLFHS